MLKTRLLEVVCGVAMLAAVPAFAQTNTPPAGTPPDAGNPSAAAPASNDGLGAPSTPGSHATHHSARGHKGGAMHAGKGNASQDSAVDQLNDQSYAAAQKGQSFTGGGGGGGSDQGMGGQGMSGQGMGGQGSGSMARPGGSGDMNAMPGGSMPDNGAAGPDTKPQ